MVKIQKCLEILESVLLFTADATQLSSRVGMWIVQQVLQGHMKTLYTCLNPGNPPDVIKAALRLLTAMVTQGASAAREVQRSFDFTLKSLGSLTNKRDTKVCNYIILHCTFVCLSNLRNLKTGQNMLYNLLFLSFSKTTLHNCYVVVQ